MRVSTSSSSITPRTTPRLSMKPLTATLSIRFVAALYSVRRIVFCSTFCSTSLSLTLVTTVSVVLLGSDLASPGERREKDRRTSAESSASTCSARRAKEARRWVGSGTSITLKMVSCYNNKRLEMMLYIEHGNLDPSEVMSTVCLLSEASGSPIHVLWPARCMAATSFT